MSTTRIIIDELGFIVYKTGLVNNYLTEHEINSICLLAANFVHSSGNDYSKHSQLTTESIIHNRTFSIISKSGVTIRIKPVRFTGRPNYAQISFDNPVEQRLASSSGNSPHQSAHEPLRFDHGL